MASQHFFLGSRHLGSRRIEDTRCIPGLEVRRHYSYAFFCMRCGDIWGRLLHDHAVLTQCVTRPCAAHGDGRFSTTHFLAGEPTNFEPDWPPAAVAHEFSCELKLAQQYLESGTYCAAPGVVTH